MLIPSIDVMGGKIVQLVQGSRTALEFDDFEPWIERFRRYPLVQVIDLDAAIGTSNNRDILAGLVRQLPCQIGGGLRSVRDAAALLQAGARRVIFGSALFRGNWVDEKFARSLADAVGREHLTFAVDAKGNRVAIRGWSVTLDLAPGIAMRLLEPYCSAFLYTHIDTEGLMCGIPLETIKAIRASTSRKLICAGGITSWDEINRLDTLGIDAVVGMAIYKKALAI